MGRSSNDPMVHGLYTAKPSSEPLPESAAGAKSWRRTALLLSLVLVFFGAYLLLPFLGLTWKGQADQGQADPDMADCSDPDAASGNMNGRYTVATGSKGPGVEFNDDYASKGHQYFDVWAPEISTHYGEVFWTDQHNLPLPDDIVQKFKGKVMAITGYEQDQVMVTPQGHPGVEPGKDVSVPINWAYNHHYMFWMTGAQSRLVQRNPPPADTSAHGAPQRWELMSTPDAGERQDTSVPTGQMFSEGNGGESRKSFHGYPTGYAQLIQSPETWHITPMQVDTRNPDCGRNASDIHRCTAFTPGVEPRQARYGLGHGGATNYSGLLECPCNSRFGGDRAIYGNQTKTKKTTHHYTARLVPACSVAEAIPSAASCFAAVAAANVHRVVKNATVSDASYPAGCSVSTDGTTMRSTATFNTLSKSTTPCSSADAASTALVGEAKSSVGITLGLTLQPNKGNVSFVHTPKGTYCGSNQHGVLATFPVGNSTAAAALAQCEAECRGDQQCAACSVDCQADGCRFVALESCGTQHKWSPGLVSGDVSLKDKGGMATITASGPADVWFGIGFDALTMADAPYTLLVNSTGVVEQKIGTCGSEAEHCPGDRLQSTVKVVSNTVADNVRTVVMTRPMMGATADHYSLSVDNPTINLITAVGTGPQFAYHRAHALTLITVADSQAPTCICDAGAKTQLCDTNGENCQSWTKDCVAAPDGSLLAQNNPTCNTEQYAGGLRCCSHGRIMLDADQPVRPELLKYHMKIRFWYEEYTPNATTPGGHHGVGKPSHYDLPRIYYTTEANAGEYDIPPAFAKPGYPIPGYPNWPANKPTPGTTCTGTCPDGPDCECIHTIHYHWKISNNRLVYAGGHCHAPSCISIELYNNDTGELLCRQLPVYGQGNFPQDKWDEAGYATLPPCLWGNEGGLDKQPWLGPNTNMLSIKRNRNTHMGHFGEMASWQMRGVYFAETEDDVLPMADAGDE